MKKVKRRLTPVGVLVKGKCREELGVVPLETLEFVVAILRYKRKRKVDLTDLWQVVMQLKANDEEKRSR